jgi:outer membrane lipase/esterase
MLGVAALTAPGAAQAANFDQYVGFGDSTLDSGYFRYHSTGDAATDQALAAAIANGASGAFVGNGVMNSTMLAGRFGLNGAPISGGGTNYAIGGAQTGVTSPPVLSTVQQIQNYLSAVNGAANSHGLYVINTGDNDVTYMRRHPGASPTYLSDQASALVMQTARLQAAGARTIMVSNSYNYAVFADLGGVISSSNLASYELSASYQASIWSGLTAAGVRFVPIDRDSVFKYVAQNPTSFGFTATSVLSTNAPCTVSALICTSITPTQQQSYLFVDGVHLTTAGQRIEADYEYSLLAAPSQMSLVTESAVQAGLAGTAVIQRQIDLSDQNRGASGFNAWVSAGADHLSLKNASGFPTTSGTPFGGAVGLDYQLPGGLVLGAALTGGDQTQKFSTGGHFSQVDEAPSVYVAYKAGPVWGSAVATYGLFQDHIARQVALGTFTDQNSADVDGRSLSVALRGGGDIDLGPVTTGPVVGMVIQRVRLDGFTETGTSGVTALSFGSQTRDSRVGQLGWRGAMDLGNWKPFAEAEWNHDWASKNKEVSASLTSATAAAYTAAVAPVAADWATASLGASYKLSEQMRLSGEASAVLGNPQVSSYGGKVSLSVGL